MRRRCTQSHPDITVARSCHCWLVSRQLCTAPPGCCPTPLAMLRTVAARIASRLTQSMRLWIYAAPVPEKGAPHSLRLRLPGARRLGVSGAALAFSQRIECAYHGRPELASGRTVGAAGGGSAAATTEKARPGPFHAKTLPAGSFVRLRCVHAPAHTRPQLLPQPPGPRPRAGGARGPRRPPTHSAAPSRSGALAVGPGLAAAATRPRSRTDPLDHRD